MDKKAKCKKHWTKYKKKCKKWKEWDEQTGLNQ